MTEIPKWEPVELELTTGAAYANPFLEQEVVAVFRADGVEHRVDGFFDGETANGRLVWRVRFAPMREGEWSWETRSADPELVARGSFRCVAPISRGSLVVDPVFRNWFVREDGTHEFVANDGWFPHVANISGTVGPLHDFEVVDFRQPSEEDWTAYLDLLAEHRIRLIVDVGQLYARQSSVTDPSFRWPWEMVDPAANRIDRDRFNLAYYQRMERQLAAAKERGIFFAMELLYDNSVVRHRDWAHHPSNVANGGWLASDENGVGWRSWFDLGDAVHREYVRRYVRYTWARFGAYWNCLWSVGSENGNLARISDERLPQAFIDPAIPAAWYAYWTDWLDRRDPYGRLKSYGDAGRQELMVTTTGNDFIVTQDPRNYPKDDPRDGYRAMIGFGELMWKFGRPVVIGEMTSGNNGDYSSERRLYWIAFTGGYAMGRSDRHFPLVIDGRIGESVKLGVEGAPPIYADIRRLVEFVESRGIRFWRMRPSPRLVASDDGLVACLAAEEEEYVLYFADGGRATLELAVDAEGEWFDPRTGATVAQVALAAGSIALDAPGPEDWVLHLRATAGDFAR